jgi:heterodisulfide reductase subunit B2
VKSYAYYPGCSCSEGSSKAYNLSTLAVAKLLDVELQEIEDWNCCGSSPYSSYDELGMISLAARNLVLAEKKGLDLVTPCSSCYVILSQANNFLKQYPQVKAKVDIALAAAGLKYENAVRVRHVLDVLVNDVGYEAITAKAKKDLSGLKVAPYYGCQIVRPQFGFDHPDNPVTMDKLITGLKAEVVDFPLKTACCGSSLVLSDEAIALDLIRKILEAAVNGGAQCIVTVCPLCQMNLDAYQSAVNRKFGTSYALPVLFVTQLMGMAFGLSENELGLETCIVPVNQNLAKYVPSQI